MRFLQVHLSMKRGGAHSAVRYLKKGMEELGHHCDISSNDPDKLTSLDYDLVIFHSFSPENSRVYSNFLEICRGIRIPRVIAMHDYWPFCHQTNMVMVGRGLTHCTEERCDERRCGWSGHRQPVIRGISNENIICFTERSAKMFEEKGFSKTHVIPHGVDMSLFSHQTREEGFPTILFTNAWGKKEIKGYRHWEWIKKNIPDGISCNEVMGEVKLADMPSIYSASRATLFLSLWEETFGLTVIESLACGTPVISYPVGVSPSVIVDGENGFLVNDSNPRTVVSLMEKMREMSPEKMKEMRDRCRSSVENRFSTSTSASRYVDLALELRRET